MFACAGQAVPHLAGRFSTAALAAELLLSACIGHHACCHTVRKPQSTALQLLPLPPASRTRFLHVLGRVPARLHPLLPRRRLLQALLGHAIVPRLLQRVGGTREAL